MEVLILVLVVLLVAVPFLVAFQGFRLLRRLMHGEIPPGGGQRRRPPKN